MSNPEKSRKPLIVGIIAAVVILGVLLALVLTNCTAGQGAKDTEPVQTTVGEETPTYSLYWNLDRALYDGKSEAGMSSRKPEADGYFHVRFFIDGEIVVLKVADRKTVNSLEVNDIMDLVFDEDGIVVGIIPLDDVPCEQVGWKFYVKSAAKTVMKLNSSSSFNGMEVLLDVEKDTGVYDMTGMEGEVGKSIVPIQGDRVIAIADLSGKLTHVFVFERPTYMKSFKAECQHCMNTVEWKMWDKTDSLPLDAGHYQLQNDVQLKLQQSMKEDAKICLDLNGYTVDGAKNARMISLHNVGCELALMDTSEAQTGKLRGHGEFSAQGGIVWTRYGAFYMYGGTIDGRDLTTLGNGAAVNIPKGTYFYMYGGTIYGGTAKYSYNAEKNTYGNGQGGAVFVQGKFVMYNGTITGGKALGKATKWKADGTPETYQRGYGGNLCISTPGEFIMEGGTIKNGTSTHNGGNIFADGTVNITLNAGYITGGKCTGAGRNGGNISIGSKVVLTINCGAYILNGTSFNCAGNLYSNGTVIMNGGLIDGGKCKNFKTGKVDATASTSNVYNVNGRFSMSGGEVTGGFGNIDTAKNNVQCIMGVGGLARITSEGKQKYPDLTLNVGGDNVLFVVANRMFDSAKIGINTSMGIFSTTTTPDNLDNFYSNVEGVPVVMYDGKLAIGRTGCACGLDKDGNHIGDCDGTELFWAPINTNAIPTGTGNYYLMKDIENVSQCSMQEDAQIRLDLNGYTLTAKEGLRAISLHNPGTYFALTDSSAAKTGKIVVFGQSKTQAACIWVRYGNAVIYQGTLDASGFKLHQSWDGAGKDEVWGTSDDKVGGRHGVAVEVCVDTTLTMYGGTIIGGETIRLTDTKIITEGEGEEAVEKEVSFTVPAGNGGAVCLSGARSVFNMYGGTIKDGKSQNSGGNVAVHSSGTFNMHGGTIQDGYAGLYAEDGKTVIVKGVGGNLYMANSSTVNILGETAVISGGQAIGNGGSVNITSGTLNMSAGLITGGRGLTDQGGNLFISGAANLTGGTISNGVAVNGGNMGINSNKAVVLQGVTISGGLANPVYNEDGTVKQCYGNGGNIRNSSTNVLGTVTIGEGTVITGGRAKNGGNISAESNNYNKTNPVITWYITGGTIENGEATAFGGNIYLAGGSAEATGTVTMSISGGTITGGKTTVAGGAGGNIRVQNIYTTLNISDNADISNGESGNYTDKSVTGWAGNIDVVKGVLNMSGGTVSGGKAPNNGGNIRVGGVDAVANITGGTITGGMTKDNGGNIWVGASGTLNVDGTIADGVYSVEIKDGTAKPDQHASGGNVHGNAGAIITLNGACIHDGTGNGSKTFSKANVSLIGSGSTVTLGNVNIPGGVYLGGHTVTVNGTPIIMAATAGDPSLTVENAVLDLTNLGEGERQIGISGTGKFAAPATEGQLGYFYSDDASKQLMFDDNALWAGSGPVKHCLCGNVNGHEGVINGCDGTVLTWTAWTGTNALPKETGNYYLTSEVIFTTTMDMNIPDQIINIDLNGQTVRNATTGQAFRLVRFLIPNNTTASRGDNVRLTIVDTVGGGQIKADVCYDQGSIFWLNATNTVVTLMSGTIDASGITVRMKADAPTTPSSANGGNAIGLDGTNNSFVMYGGTFIGGNTPYGGDALFGNTSSNISIYGGTIQASETSPTGTVIRSFGTATISGGTIEGAVEMNSKDGKGNLTLSGNPEIELIKLTKTADYVGTPSQTGSLPVITITGELSNTTPINVSTMGDAVGAITAATVEANADNFASAVDNCEIKWNAETNTIELVETVAGPDLTVAHCICGVDSEDPADHKGYTDPNGNFVGCDGTKVDWTAWESSTSLPSATGYYYLTKKVTTGQTNVATDANVVLDLNGYEVRASGNNRLYSLHNPNAKLTVTDLKGGGEMIRSETYASQGGVIWVRNQGGTVLTILDGTFTGSQAFLGASGNVIEVDKDRDCKFYMLGGTINGGNSTANGAGLYVCNKAEAYLVGGTITGGVAGNGGNVYVAGGGKLVVDGGTITDGFAKLGTSGGYGGNICCYGQLVIKSGTISGGSAYKLDDSGNPVYYEYNGTYNAGKGWGGNILVSSDPAKDVYGSLVIGTEDGENDDVTISGGISGGNGGNIYAGNGVAVTVNCGTITTGRSMADSGGNIWVGGTANKSGVAVCNSSLTILNASITDGVVKNNGGNIHANANATVSILGGTISGGKKDTTVFDPEAAISTTHASANVSINAGTGVVTIGSVTIDGYVNIGKVTTLTITGNPQINTGVTNMTIGANDLVLSDVASTASVGVSPDQGVFAPGAAESMLNVFFADKAENEVLFTENGLEYGPAQAHVHCVCGGTLTNGQVLADGSTHTCVDVTWTPADSVEDLKVAGNYYLTRDLVVSAQTVISGVNVNVCLNGRNIIYITDAETVTGSRVLSVAAGANVTLTSCKKDSTNNSLIRVGTANINGGVVHVDGGSTLNLYGIKLDGSGLTIKGSGGGKHGGTLRLKNSTVNMYSGTIVGATMVNGGDGCHGGGVALEGTDATTTTFNMVGGTIRDGIAHQWGGNVYIFQGTFNMYAGEIKGGKIGTNPDNQHANIDLRATGVLNISGGFIDGNVSCGTGGGTVNISGSAQILRRNNLVSNGVFYEKLTITIGDLNDDAKIALAIRNLNKVATDKMETENIKLATVLEGFVEAEDMAKIGLQVIEKPAGKTYGLKLVGTEILAYKTN